MADNFFTVHFSVEPSSFQKSGFEVPELKYTSLPEYFSFKVITMPSKGFPKKAHKAPSVPLTLAMSDSNAGAVHLLSWFLAHLSFKAK